MKYRLLTTAVGVALLSGCYSSRQVRPADLPMESAAQDTDLLIVANVHGVDREYLLRSPVNVEADEGYLVITSAVRRAPLLVRFEDVYSAEFEELDAEATAGVVATGVLTTALGITLVVAGALTIASCTEPSDAVGFGALKCLGEHAGGGLMVVIGIPAILTGLGLSIGGTVALAED